MKGEPTPKSASRTKGGGRASKPDDLRLHKDGGEGVHKDSSVYSHIMMKVQQLNRKKDIVCLILSYPPMNFVNRRRHELWIQDILKINEMVREMEASSEKKVIDALELSFQITRLLNHTQDDIEAYVPREIINKMCTKTLEVDMSIKGVTMRSLSTGSIKQEAIPVTMSQDDIEIEMTVSRHGEKRPMQEKLLNLVVDFTICQILQEIENPKLLRIGISGGDVVRVTSALMNLTKIKEIFDVVIQVNGSLHSTIIAIEENIATQLGLSTLTGLDELLKGINFLIILENNHEWIELYKLGTNWWNSKKIQKIVSTTRFHDVHQRMLLDLVISMDDHLLSWELFCSNVNDAMHSSVIQCLALHVVKECRGHLLAIVLLARALKGVTDVHIWEYAYHALGLRPAFQMKDDVLFNTLAFICGRLGNSEKNCLKYFVDMEHGGKLEKVSLISRWITGGLIRKLDEGEKIVCDLVNAFLLESSWNGDFVFVQMRSEICEALMNLLGLETKLLYLWLGGEGLTKPPTDVAWEKANEVHLMNNTISELPKSLDCPQLRALFLQINHHLRVIPTMFFEHMPVLQILDLSYTRIRSLPQSLSNLVQLRIFLLRGCRLLMELPPEVGALSNLEVLNLEETEIINLPMNVGRLTNLKSLKVSFYGYNNRNRKNNRSSTMIPQNVISKLLQLEELSIYVSPEDERWNVTVKDIVKEVCSLKRLEALTLYLPEVILLDDFMWNGTSSINLSLLNFRFIVGNHSKRFISRLPHEIAVKFEQQERCLKYVNGEGVPVEIKDVLRHTTALLLDRHLTLTKLSEFGFGNIKNLEFCVLGECSEIESLVDGAEIYTQGDEGGDVHAEIILGSLQYLRLYYMKNLRSMWKGPIQRGCLSNLKSLELHACPNLTTILTLDLLENLNILEELVVERCPEINSIVTHEVSVEHGQFPSVAYLPKLKKLSLHYMPKLVSISSSLRIAPTLEWMSFYNCPNLQALSDMEVSSNNLKVIIGQADWWSALKWSTSDFRHVLPCNLDSIFVAIKQDIDLMTQLAEIGIQHLAPKQERKPFQQSGSDDTMKDPVVEAGTTFEVKQLYEPTPLSPFSIEEGTSIRETGTTSKEKQLYEPASLSSPPEGIDSMKAPAVEGGTTSEEKQLYEPVPLLFLMESGDSIKAPAVEARRTTLKEKQLCEPASSRWQKVDKAVQGFRDIEEIKLAQRDPYHLELGPCQVPNPPFVTGLDLPLKELKTRLFGDCESVTVVSAPGGCGKTTLAKLLCHDHQVKGKFKNNIFYVTVSKAFNLNVIIQKLFQLDGYRVPVFQNDEDAVNWLEQLLKRKAPAPILLVLDDVWSGSESLLEKFVFKIPDYKILVTSRYEFPSFGSTYHLRLLTDEDALALFCHSAFLQDGSSYMPDEDLVKQIVKGCKGLPLALSVVGKSLCGQPAEAWERRLMELSDGQSIFSSESDLLLCLQSSLDALDDKGILKECFTDLGSFPEDQKIPANALIDMWTELYKLHRDGVFAINNLHDLSFRSLLSLIDARKDACDVDGYYNDTYVMQHDLLRELAIHQSGQEPIEQRKRLIVDLRGNEVPNWWTQDKQQAFKARLLSISTDELFSSWCKMQTPEVEVLILNFQSKKNYILPEFIKQMEKLKVLILTNNGLCPAELINFSVLCSLPSLKRIRFEQIRILPLCNTAAELKNLEKISLVMCKISEALSNCSIQISNMFPNLVELNIDYCYDLVELPEGLCDLVELKKVSISYCHKLSALPKGIGKLGNLEVLRLRYCTGLSELPDSIGRLHKLIVLDISGCLQIKEIPKEMGELCNLTEVHMRECWRLCELPVSVMNLVGLKKVICDTETAMLWEPFEYHLENLRIWVHEEKTNLDWL